MERLETNTYNETMIEHLHRYAITLDFCAKKTILDIACGEGYGSNLIARKALKVIGVDIAFDVIESAQLKYQNNNLQFLQGSADKIPCENNFFDVVVSFETIEHHDKHHEMLSEIKRVLKPEGLTIISTPDKLIYTDKKMRKNPYHIKELYKNDFISLLSAYFSNVRIFRQKSFFSSLIIPDEIKEFSKNIKFYQGNYSNISSANEIESEYLIGIASDSSLLQPDMSLFVDEAFVANKEDALKKSTRYQFGNLILNPIQFFKEKAFGNKKK